MAINYIPRVTQLDALQLDREVEELFKNIIFHATKYLEPGILQPILPELELLIRTMIFKYSVYDRKRTFGQEMLSVRYKTENFSKSKIYWYYGYTIGLKYLKDRLIYSFTSNTTVQSVIHRLEMFQVFCDIMNFIKFVQSGRHPMLIDCILGLELTADKLMREDLRDFSWTRELLWHNLIELLGTTLALINMFGLKSKVSSIIKQLYWKTQAKPSMKLTPAVMTIKTLCAYCSNSPVLPHVMGCSHIFCYYCLSANKAADPNFVCPKCYHNGKDVQPYIHVTEK